MQNFKKVLSSVLMFSFLVFNTSPLIVLATENIDEPTEPAVETVETTPSELPQEDENKDPAPEEESEEVAPLIEESRMPLTVVQEDIITISAKKVICDAEQYLPNWGDGTHSNIDANTASSWVADSNNHCQIAPEWSFQWGDQNAPDMGATYTGEAESGYTTFSNSVDIPLSEGLTEIHLREVLPEGYIPFTGQNTTEDVSAEFYCTGDALNYDNWDFIRGPVAGGEYHCVAFNVLTEQPQVCNAKVNLLENASFEDPELSGGTWDIILNSNPLLKWLVSWTNPETDGRLGLEIQNNVAGDPSEGDQHAELDGDHPVTISQTVPTIVGETYDLSFDYSARPARDANDNKIEVIAGGNLLDTLSDDGTSLLNTFWNGKNYSFVATSTSTTIEFKDTGTDTSFGGYLDDVSLNCNPEPIPQCNANATSDIVSDASTQVDSGDAELLTPIHEAWTASIPGASWIWSTNPVTGPTNNADDTEVFTKTFNIVGTPTGGTLYIAADNNYSVKVNGTSVPVVFDQNNFQLATQDTYNVLPMLVSGSNTLEITVTNWEIGQDASPANNPAGLLYKLSLTNNECEQPIPLPTTSTVTMCKQDASIPVGESGNYYPMPGWTLTLTGESVEDLSVPANALAGVSTVNPLVAGASYIAKAVGTWLNQGGANPVDAEYSTTDAWATQMDGYTGYQNDILELQIDNEFDPGSNWGAYNTLHTYVQGFVPSSTSANFRIFDGTGTTPDAGWYGDNSGSLAVNISKGYIGTTAGFDNGDPAPGCVKFTDVPYGTYTAGEIMQDGWQNVSGLGTVTVDSPTEKFTILNKSVGTININKYVCPADTAINRTANGVGGTVPEGCVPQAGATFGYTYDTTKIYPDVTGPYKGLSDATPFTPLAVTDANGVSLNTGMPTNGRYVIVETDSNGAQLPHGSILGMYCEQDGDTNPNNNDNQEITYILGPGNDTNCVAYNKAPSNPNPATLKVHIYKYLKNGEVTAQIPNDSTAPSFPMTSSWDASNLGAGSGAYVLGDYHGGTTLKYAADTSPMNAPADYTTSETIGGNVVATNSESCPAGSYRFLGYKSGTSLELAEASALSATAPVYTDITTDRYVIVVNEKCPDVLGETATSETLVVTNSSLQNWLIWNYDADDSSDMDDVITVSGTDGTFVTGPAPAPLGSGSFQQDIGTNGDDANRLVTSQFNGTPLANITELGYSTFVSNFGSGGQATYVQIRVDTDNDGTWDDALFFEPVYQTGGYSTLSYSGSIPNQCGVIPNCVDLNTWQTWNLKTGGWWTNNDSAGGPPLTDLAGYIAEYPNAKIATDVPAVRMQTGFGGAAWQNFLGNFDKFVIGIKTGLNTHTVTYDFEPTVSESVPACSDESDNDEDGLSDANDPGCHTDGDVNNEESYNPEDNSESNSSTQCSDGLNNDGEEDSLIDSNDPGCMSGDGNVWNPSDDNEADDSNGGGGGSSNKSSNNSNGAVLGATTTCGIYVDKYLRRGYQNDVEAVKKVQKFLNDYMQAGLTEDGIFGFGTEIALKKFQLAHADKILTPWGFSKPTGIFYITTQTEVNNIMCPELMLAIPELIPIALNPLAPKKG